jgi:hypothetical protein
MKTRSPYFLARLPAALTAFTALAVAGCSADNAPASFTMGGSGNFAGSASVAGSAGISATAGTSGSGGAGAAGQASGGTGGGAGGSSGSGGATAGSGGSAAGAGAGGTAGTGGGGNVGGSVNNVPADYKGTPFTALQIPGRINACDYDRGGAGVAWCHDAGNCSAGTVTGDYPGGSGVYRAPMPANAQICSGAACADNVGVCRMNPSKPDNTINGQAMPPTDTYLCYSVAGEWTKYTVVVAEAGTYSVGGSMAVPPSGGGVNLSFGGNITTGNLSLAVTPNTNSGSGENFHSWDDRKNLGTVTFPAAGTYVMTLTQVARFNADAFTFTKM